MAQCAAGSQKQASAPAFFQFDSVTAASFLPFPSAIAWLGLVGLPVGPVDTAQFCSVEPPATSMSAGDWISLGVPPLAKINGAYSRLADWIQQQAFSTYCVCSGTSSGTYAPWILSLGPGFYLKLGDAVGTLTLADSSGNGNTGNNLLGVLGQAALMSGDSATSCLLSVSAAVRQNASAANLRWSGSTNMSMEWWATFTTPAANAAMYDNYNGHPEFVRAYILSNGHALLTCRDHANVQITSAQSAGVVAAATVHQFDIVLDAAAHTLTLYIDAVQACQCTGLATDAYMESTAHHFLGLDPDSAPNAIALTAGHWSVFPAKALSAVQISDNKAAAGGTTIFQPPTYTPPADGTPPAGIAPVCASYQDICNQLYITDQLLLGLGSQLTMFTSRTTPTFFRAEKTHAGLTGTGVLTVQDILGLHVSLTTVPATWGSTAETPRRLIPAAGSIQAGSASQYTDNLQVHYEEELMMLKDPWATQVRYNFRPGIIATVVELVPAG